MSSALPPAAGASEQRGWRNDKRVPPRSGQLTAGSSEEDSINRPQPWLACLAPSHRELVAQRNDLILLEVVRAKAQRRKLPHATKHD
jgi:hypothetical protein